LKSHFGRCFSESGEDLALSIFNARFQKIDKQCVKTADWISDDHRIVLEIKSLAASNVEPKNISLEHAIKEGIRHGNSKLSKDSIDYLKSAYKIDDSCKYYGVVTLEFDFYSRINTDRIELNDIDLGKLDGLVLFFKPVQMLGDGKTIQLKPVIVTKTKHSDVSIFNCDVNLYPIEAITS